MPLKLQIGLKDNQETQAREIPNIKNRDNDAETYTFEPMTEILD